MVEINPLVVTAQGDLTALDAKIAFDDNALFRHPEIEAYRDLSEEAPAEIEAAPFGLNFIKLDGTIGCMVNGAGLAMATMDIIKLHGATPANFLDVGGGASEEAVKNAFRIILQDPGVKAVLVNIFGGHHALRHRGQGHRQRRPGRSASGCRWWCAWRAPTWRRASASSRTAA